MGERKQQQWLTAGLKTAKHKFFICSFYLIIKHPHKGILLTYLSGESYCVIKYVHKSPDTVLYTIFMYASPMVNTTIIYPDVGTLNECSMRTRRSSSVIWGPRLDDKCVE